MKYATIKLAALLLFLFAGVFFAGAATLTVGPTGQYATPCPAIKAASPGDTITIDYNNGIPYQEPADPTHGSRSDCVWFTNNLTIVGVNGRPILDANGEIIQKGIFNPYGADTVVSNLEFRNSATQPGQGDNGAAIRVDSGTTNSPAGGNITVQFCYIHDNQDGILTANVGPGSAGEGSPDPNADGQYLSANPYITFLNDEFANNGVGGDGHTHNMYIGFDAGNTEVFNLEYSWTHDVYLGHTVKSRAPFNNVLYNLITDQVGSTSYMLNFPLGGSTYVVGNAIYKSQTTNSSANRGFMLWRDVGDNTPSDPEYGLPLEDFHFVNNTVVLDPTNNTPAYVVLSCQASDVTSCSAPSNGPVLSVNAVVQNNIFVGPSSLAVNQTTAVASHNLIEANTPANLAALFVDWSHYNYHLAAGAPAIQAGLYPPTDNTGAADPKALAAYEYVQPMGEVARPTPSGSTMDEGAYSYPRVDTPPSPSLGYPSSVTTPATGTITISGLPTPPSGSYNDASFVSGNTAIIPQISTASSTTGTITAPFTACCASTTTTVPIDIYVDGAHLTANITVVPGAVDLQSITLDNTYYPETTVHLTNASTSPVVIDLSTTDPTILAVPSTVTVPANQLTAETGSETGSLWGQSPPTKTATISATYPATGTTKTLPVTVYAPFVNHFYCNVYDPGCDVVGGNTVNFQVAIAGDFPAGGGPVIFTSDTPSVIPNQTFTGPAGNFYTGFNLTTNTVSTSTNVTMSISVNGSTKLPNQVVTVTPASGTNVVVASGSGQSSPVGTNFASPLLVTVTNAGSPVSGTTVTFAGSGVSFPSGSTAVTNSSGQASVVAQPTATGALTISATVSGGNGPAVFSETGTAGAAASVAVVSGSGQSAAVGSNFTNPLVTVVKDASGNPVSGVTVTYAGTNVTFPSGATAVTNSSGQASVVARPGATGSLTVTASVSGVGTPASFSETGTAAAPASVTVVSGSGQSAAVGSNFTNPLVVVVKDASGNPVSGVTVTYAGTNVTFPSGATAVTNSSGDASVVAQPSAAGSLTVTASVSGVGTPASFSETGTSGVSISSITQDNNYQSGTTVHLSAAAPTGGAVVTLSTSDSTILYTPSSVTVPAGATSAETGTLLGSLWGQTPTSKPATLTATYNGTKTLTMNVDYATIHAFGPNSTVVGGQPLGFYFESAFNAAPVGGGPYTISSDHPSIIPTQNYTLAAGQTNDFGKTINTNTVTTSTTVNVTLTYNGASWGAAVTVTPGANSPASIAVVSGSGQSSPVGTNFTNPLVVVVENSSGAGVSGATVTFAGSGVSFPSGATAVTNSSGQASVVAQPTTTGSLTVTASVSGVGTPATFSETGTAAGVAISSITQDNNYQSGTTVHLVSAAPTGGQVVSLSTSNSSILYTPASVTVPAGATSAETGSLLGSAWGQTPFQQSATLTGIAAGVTKTLTMNVYTASLHAFNVNSSVVGGQQLGYYLESAFNAAPYGGLTYTVSSDQPAIIPTQQFTMPAGQVNDFAHSIATNAVSTTTTVNVSVNYNGAIATYPVTVNP